MESNLEQMLNSNDGHEHLAAKESINLAEYGANSGGFNEGLPKELLGVEEEHEMVTFENSNQEIKLANIIDKASNPFPLLFSETDRTYLSPVLGYNILVIDSVMFTTDNLPICGKLKIIYSSQSNCMIHSESLVKLLLSLKDKSFGKSIYIAKKTFQMQLLDFLSKRLLDVQVKFFDSVDIDIYHEKLELNYIDLYPELVAMEEITGNLLDTNGIQDLEYIPTNLGRTFKLYTNCLSLTGNYELLNETKLGSAYIHIDSKESEINHLSVLNKVISLKNLNEGMDTAADKLLISIMRSGVVKQCCNIFYIPGKVSEYQIRTTNQDLIPNQLLDINTIH